MIESGRRPAATGRGATELLSVMDTVVHYHRRRPQDASSEAAPCDYNKYLIFASVLAHGKAGSSVSNNPPWPSGSSSC